MGKKGKSAHLFGVLISNKAWREMTKNKTPYRLQQLAKVNSSVNFNMYFFNMRQVDTKAKTISAYYYDPADGKWKKDIFPYPDVLYRRGGATKRDRARFKKFMKQCRRNGTVFLNPAQLGNWEIYNYFNKVESLQEYLLETILFREPDDLMNMLFRHEKVYLKGVTGRKGKNVMRVSVLPDNIFQTKNYSHRKDKVRIYEFDNFDDLIAYVKSFYKGKNFMVQEAIELLEVEDRIIDLRAELQRNKSGEIDITGVSARVSQKNSPITINSVAYPVQEFFETIGMPFTQRMKLKQDINHFLRLVYTETEKKYGKFAEIGIDFGLTKDFKIKFIECNSQSAKVSLLKAYGEEAFNHALLNILQSAEQELQIKKGAEEDQGCFTRMKVKTADYWDGFTEWVKEGWKKL
ncbi:YheC/YheD family protein [Evansella sp. LMS18]|uniref:YheC/YheD family endospore coat-associated protein n=1 Tax=Evansella sp. LMS18 TaxID=2924033 RepID=UPI0020D19EE7|nr:YheC/YheD family protein [Evansella sp. LMS18]UTR10150.1 YheC/YheD family protein [Evansella sp. LMS18]